MKIIYYRVENQKLVPLESITYRVNTDQWYRDNDCDPMTEDLTPITDEEAESVQNSHPHVHLELKAVYQLISDETTMALYRSIIDTCITAINEKWKVLACNEADISYMIGNFLDTPEELGYALRDLDGNGVQELLLFHGGWDGDGQMLIDLYTISMGKAVHVICGGERDKFYMRGFNTIMELVAESSAGTSWGFYMLKGSRMSVQEIVHYDETTGSYYRGEPRPAVIPDPGRRGDNFCYENPRGRAILFADKAHQGVCR